MTLNNLTLKNKLTLGFSIPILSLLIISFVVYQSVAALLNANHWVDHTHKVIAEGKSILGSMVDMETGMRGFLIGGKNEFLEPYVAGKTDFDKTIKKLQNTVSDNPTQVARLKKIKEMKTKWIKEAAEPQISMRREIVQGESAAKEFKRISARLVGKEKFDGVRAALAEIEHSFIKEKDLKGRFILLSTLSDMVNKETGQRGFLLSGQEASLAPFNQGKVDFVNHVQQLEAHLAKVKYPTSANLKSLEKANKLAQEWTDLAALPEIEARRAMNKVTVSFEDLNVMIAAGAGKKNMDAIRVEIADFVKAEVRLIASRTKEAESIGKRTELVTLFSSISASILAILAAYYIVTNVLKLVGQDPQELDKLSRRIANGDLSMRLNKTGNETGIYSAMIDMVDSLKSLLVNISNSSDSQTKATERLSATSEQTIKNVNEQNHATDQVAAAMEEMHATASEVANSSGLVASSATEARQLVDLGNSKAELVAEEIKKLSVNLDDTSEVIQKLSNDAGNISNILDVIKGIADQTNLLALNAAIEAARAGEQGRGFAVVADEVRSLAQNTQNSTLEIESMIQKVQQGANDSVKSMSIGRNQTEAIVSQTLEVSGALTDIKSAVHTITDMTSQIATAAQEQQQTSDEINRRVVDIRELSTQTGEGTNEINSSTQELIELTNTLHNEVRKFKV